MWFSSKINVHASWMDKKSPSHIYVARFGWVGVCVVEP